jgi:hypothetical protein
MRPRKLFIPIFGSAALLLASCDAGPLTFAAPYDGSISVPLGSEVRLQLQNIGPGEFGTPSISSGSVRFVGVEEPEVAVPAGVTQIFRFKAVGPGVSVIVISRSGWTGPITVTDTIVVR